MKIRSVLLFAAVASSAVPAFSQTMTVSKDSYKPGEAIQMTVNFDSPVELGSTVSVTYQLRGPASSDQKTFSTGLRFRGSPSSSDSKAFILQAMVDETVASGEYVFGS